MDLVSLTLVSEDQKLLVIYSRLRWGNLTASCTTFHLLVGWPTHVLMEMTEGSRLTMEMLSKLLLASQLLITLGQIKSRVR